MYIQRHLIVEQNFCYLFTQRSAHLSQCTPGFDMYHTPRMRFGYCLYHPVGSDQFICVYISSSKPLSRHVCCLLPHMRTDTSTGIDADASKGETSPGYFNSKLVYSYRCGTIFPWEFPEISLAYSHIFLKGPSRSIIYGQIFWHPHPHPHIASPACIYHQNQLSFAFRFPFI